MIISVKKTLISAVINNAISNSSDLQITNRTSNEHISGKNHSVFNGGQANRNPLGVSGIVHDRSFRLQTISIKKPGDKDNRILSKKYQNIVLRLSLSSIFQEHIFCFTPFLRRQWGGYSCSHCPQAGKLPVCGIIRFYGTPSAGLSYIQTDLPSPF